MFHFSEQMFSHFRLLQKIFAETGRDQGVILTHRDTPVTYYAPEMAHEWSYIKSSIKHQPQQTRELYAPKIPSCPLKLKNIQQHPLPAITIVHGKVSLTCRFEGSLSSFHAADVIHNQFLKYFHLKYNF